MTKFNTSNTGYKTGHYPLFLGEEMGFPDTVNITYPVLEELYQKQLVQIWNEFEVSLTQDLLEMKTLDKRIVNPMRKTILTQTIGDAVAARSLSATLMRWVTNPEMENWINLVSFFETIHNRTYAHIIKQTFENPMEMLEEAYNDPRVLNRSQAIVKAFDDLEALSPDASELDKRVAILVAFTALFALEAIMFMSSFAVTFGIAETGVFQGIAKLVEMICKDEVLHTRADYEILNILKHEGSWAAAMAIASPKMKEVLDSVTQHELEWSHYVLEDGEIVGLTSDLLNDYVLYNAQPVYRALNIPFDFKAVNTNPLKYMEKYIDSSMIQVANQEMQSGQYQVNATIDDTDDLSFDDDDLF